MSTRAFALWGATTGRFGLAAMSGAAFFISRRRIRELTGLRVESELQAERITSLCQTDGLTGLTNRAHLLALLEARHGDHWVFCINIDNFKAVNDRYGHLVGDQTLAEIGRRLAALPLPTVAMARVDGDEFVAVVEQDAVASPTEFGELLLRAVERPIKVDETHLNISVTIGFSALREGEDASQALGRADQAMRHGKSLGHRSVVTYSSEIGAASIVQGVVEDDVSTALQNGDIHAWAQPIFDLDTGQVVGVELLARWFDADGLAVSPEIFVPIAAAAGSLPLLTTRMIDTAADLLVWWGARPGFRHISVGVNIPPAGLGDGWLIGEVSERFSRKDAPIKRLVLELTEGEGIADMAMAATELDSVIDLGTTIVLDDFGSGYSSLGQLIHLPVHWAKLDITLIERLGTDDRSTTLVAAIAAAARDVGVGVVAEGVETLGQLAAVRSIGIRFGQGFALGLPMPLDQLDAFIERGVSWTTADLAPAG